MTSARQARLTCCATVVLLALAATARAQQVDEALIKKSPWRSVGPAGSGGRIVDIAVAGESPQRIYGAAATGGVWKSTNQGRSWEPIFDHERVASVGDIAVDPNTPDTIWVG